MHSNTTLTKNQIEDVNRTLRNLCSVPTWEATLSKDQVDYLFENHSDLIFCNGHARRIKTKELSTKFCKVISEPA
jgi:hypothetical protein